MFSFEYDEANWFIKRHSMSFWMPSPRNAGRSVLGTHGRGFPVTMNVFGVLLWVSERKPCSASCAAE
jgi:hypothetical protein